MNERSNRPIQVRPQPIGIFPLAAADLLLPAVSEEAPAALAALMRGDLETPVPAEWEFLKAAARGETELALATLPDERLDPGVIAYNRFVLEPSSEKWQALRKESDADWRTMIDLAAFTAGLVDELPALKGLDGELLAHALAADASRELENRNVEAASERLWEGVEAAAPHSPVLAASLVAQAAELGRDSDQTRTALLVKAVREALDAIADCPVPLLKADLQFALGALYQQAADGNRGALLEAIRAYQAALQEGVNEREFPERFAELQNNLGLAYLSMPVTGSSHQLRTGIAIQSFRHALKIYQPETHPEQWARTSMNLANALQYAPTSHPEENLVQAVETYEQVLQVRTRARDPVAYALVLLNQANALAHLGMFRPALEKLSEAHKLFHWHDLPEPAAAARDLVEQINERRSEADGSMEPAVN